MKINSLVNIKCITFMYFLLVLSCGHSIKYTNNINGNDDLYSLEISFDSVVYNIDDVSIRNTIEIFSNFKLIGEIKKGEKMIFYSKFDSLDIEFSKSLSDTQFLYKFKLDLNRMNQISVTENKQTTIARIYKSTIPMKIDTLLDVNFPTSSYFEKSNLCLSSYAFHTVLNTLTTGSLAIGGLMAGAFTNNSMENGLKLGGYIYLFTFPLFYAPCFIQQIYINLNKPNKL